ncbi:YfhE family protein [Peribacillus kribbensis]|nr:YfhE family protein [Peribacillus kribbensis]
MEKKRNEKQKNHLTSAQEVTYNREFKKADRAAGYTK